MRSFVALNRVDYGFDAERLAAGQLDLGSSRYASDESQIAFVDGLRDRNSALPGVESVAGTSDPPVVARRSRGRG